MRPNVLPSPGAEPGHVKAQPVPGFVESWYNVPQLCRPRSAHLRYCGIAVFKTAPWRVFEKRDAMQIRVCIFVKTGFCETAFAVCVSCDGKFYRTGEVADDYKAMLASAFKRTLISPGSLKSA